MRANSEHLWQFADSVDTERSAKLLAHDSFEQVADSLLSTFTIEAYCPESARASHLKGCRRVAFLLKVSAAVYDAFFNSPVGYRACYAGGRREGAKANRAILDALTPSLTQYAASRGEAGRWVQVSLKGQGAKIWIYEDEVANQMAKPGPDILYPPWQAASDDGAGLLAPVGNKLEVKGGWISADRREILDPTKANRSEEIHETGYT